MDDILPPVTLLLPFGAAPVQGTANQINKDDTANGTQIT
jgi:hypothetical protein|tara:strand:- start:501 stop:617 length:117 start_codon:yes stop_codon:yes gene_type:complete